LFTDESKASEGYADRKSDLNKAWKTWIKGDGYYGQLQYKDEESTRYNSWYDFAKDNGATDEEADDTWDKHRGEIFGYQSSTYSKAREGVGDFLETPELQKIRNDWDNVMTHEEKVDMLTGMAYMSQINKTFDNLLWETKESVALTIGQRLGLDVDMGTFYGERYLKMLQNQYMD
jgi:hypothetical protein